MLLVDNDFKIIQNYNKKRLVPFGEFLPFEEFLNNFGLKKITEGHGSFLKGKKIHNLSFDKINFFDCGTLPKPDYADQKKVSVIKPLLTEVISKNECIIKNGGRYYAHHYPPKNLQNKINIQKKLDFGNANLVIAVPDDWIDVQTIADLEEVSFDIRSKRNSRLRVATKYPNLTNDFLISKGVTQYKLIISLGATETYPFIGSSEIITDITSTGKTLADNNLRVLKDGLILSSNACLFIAKKKAAKLQPFLKYLV